MIRPVRPEDAEELKLVRRYLRINGDWRDFFPFQRGERLDRLRIDVHHGVEPGATHRRSGRGEQRGRARGERPRPVGLADELGAVPAAQP